MLRNIIVGLTLILIALLPFVIKEPDASVATGIRIIRDVSYVPGSEDRRQSLDFYLPKTKYGKTLPMIVWIHGGGWIGGDKADNVGLEVASEGFSCASINYRLAPKHIFPAQIYDCKAAIRWLRAHAEEYAIDTERMGVWGVSAGGHLAALLGTSGGIKELEGDLGSSGQSSKVTAVCDWCGPADLKTFKDQCPPDLTVGEISPPEMVSLFLGGSAEEKPELASEASPVTYVSADDPPFLIMHSENDPIVPFAQSEELYKKLRKSGVDSRLVKLHGSNHMFFDDGTFKTVLEFFKQKLDGNS